MVSIPSEEDWGDYQNDYDMQSAYKIFFGKTNEEVTDDFYRDVLSRVSELRFMPLKPFQYYMIGFKEFVEKGKFRQFTSADCVSSFLEIIEFKLETEKESILPIINELIPTVEYITTHQEKYGAEESIYGNFIDRKNDILRMLA